MWNSTVSVVDFCLFIYLIYLEKNMVLCWYICICTCYLQEVKMQLIKDWWIPEFKLFLNNRQRHSRNRSGGIGGLIKDSIIQFIHIDTFQTSSMVYSFRGNYVLKRSHKLWCSLCTALSFQICTWWSVCRITGITFKILPKVKIHLTGGGF